MIQEIQTAVSGSVLSVRLNRPDKKNALTIAMYEALRDAIVNAAEDPDILVVTLTGAEGIFSAGNDLKDFQAVREQEPGLMVFDFLRALSTFPKILIAGVAGPAVGIGTTMLFHCDLVLAAPSARFSMPFVDLALVPEAASSLLFPRLVGRQLAAKHMILAEPFDAETALAYGLVTHLVGESEVGEQVSAMAERIAAKPPEAVRLTKALLTAPEEGVSDRIAREGKLFEQRLRSAEAAEAFAAFFEKRPPDFTRR